MIKNTLIFLSFFTFMIGHLNGQTKNYNNKKHQRPNVILIMADDIGIDDLSFLHNGLNNTPI
ncbi:hypothetical protein [Polaribacter atrinae]|uniref:hypothetical protein n=1 Tax=Polaribacter atrinae TaxID=1333662 RepID=UPI0024914CBB|nr:hypothetical protein [Polaribacter atrinae]